MFCPPMANSLMAAAYKPLVRATSGLAALVWLCPNADEDVWLRAETANERLKQNTRTQDADCMPAVSVLYMTQLDAISQQ